MKSISTEKTFLTQNRLVRLLDVIKGWHQARLEIWLDKHIVGSHLRRLGPLRVTIGGGSMYLSLPLFLFAHLVFIELLLNRILTPLLGLQKLKTTNYIVLDRHRIKGLSRFDKINCVFCGYANGISVLLNEKICQIAERRKELGSFSSSFNILLSIILAVFLPFLVIVKFAGMDIIYDILVSRPLYMHRTRTKDIKRKVLSTGSADIFNQNTLFDMLILHSKIIVIRLIEALEQIESSWCPIKHKKAGEDVRYPLHHRNFFEPDDLEEMRRTLYRNGTVSDKKPLVEITNPVYPSDR
jgi:hypothetical protein